MKAKKEPRNNEGFGCLFLFIYFRMTNYRDERPTHSLLFWNRALLEHIRIRIAGADLITELRVKCPVKTGSTTEAKASG